MTEYKDKAEFNHGHILEALDRVHTIETMMNALLVDHPAIIKCDADNDVKKVMLELGELYQKIGNLY